ncbi:MULTISPECIES: acyl-CoA dehydrogenase family protein [Peribacillus]|jgi:acyl-CoA dehydrogenase|uniref:acyl-CoA dehydrogenase family protein n=1 Tax=Peribacillus TaxID=2675229 RepID=UPI0005513BA5|nr:acyl-CoA dehydrogenase family protein [Peribacillus frigoritolerans]KOR78676.1 acyl-CoA dehydrogenase [Bacillus sp. FJAT-21352]KOR83187.1 acyl-CoA dehydrogenase [Bacillus sp. FJAT-22058]MCD1160950.1 acyl-CoA dehydrogenase family protein [Peribacillus castrilensis]MDP9741319.1 acyl-CoA dehydrogenase [Bacillus sp. B2I3]PCD08104.1 acyl-CoA dehydrogenase [Peribacillus simplex]PHD73955.1 acyl-CoA dehydrogenase [Bacillus sp. AFS043905]PRS42694.1 acyl-CoA dehydrogenase [Bacillus sp. RJGP41]QYF8
MDFRLDEDILLLKENIRQFIEEQIDPFSMQIEDEDHIPESIINLSKEIGLFGLSIPERYGGLGIGMVGKCALYEEIGKTHNGYTTLIGAHTGIGTVGIVEMGNEMQKEKYLPDMASGNRIGAFALTEPAAGSHATNLKMTAVKNGDKYILNGTKHYITNADVADIFTVMAVTDKDKGAKGITSFIVEKDFPGFRVGSLERKMGLRGSHSAELFFEDCEVPAENVLGDVGQGYVNALKILANGRAGLAARNLGSCQYLLDLSTKYATEREQFNVPIIDHQAVSHMIAEMAMEIEALRSFTYRVAWMVDQKEKIIKEAAMLKLYGSEVYNRIADKAVQIHGGMGYMKDYPVERFYRDARITRIYEGTSEIQKNIITGQLKRKYQN